MCYCKLAYAVSESSLPVSDGVIQSQCLTSVHIHLMMTFSFLSCAKLDRSSISTLMQCIKLPLLFETLRKIDFAASQWRVSHFQHFGEVYQTCELFDYAVRLSYFIIARQ
jgi:hypothetical protein